MEVKKDVKSEAILTFFKIFITLSAFLIPLTFALILWKCIGVTMMVIKGNMSALIEDQVASDSLLIMVSFFVIAFMYFMSKLFAEEVKKSENGAV